MNHTRQPPKRNLRPKPPKAATNHQKRSRQKLLLPASRKQLRRNRQKNPTDDLGTASQIGSNRNRSEADLDEMRLALGKFLQLRDERLGTAGEMTVKLPQHLYSA